MEAAISIRSILVVALLGSLILAGCGGSGTTTTTTTAPTITESGTDTSPASSTTALETVPITSAGTLVGTMQWTAPPSGLYAYFELSGDPSKYGQVMGVAPALTSTVNVPASKTGDYILYIENGSTDSTSVSWTITFTP